MTSSPDLSHLLPHFTSAKYWRSGAAPVFARGEGCYLWDHAGNRYLDTLAGLFVVQIGHGRTDIAKAMSEQAEQLAFFPSWSATTPVTLEAASLITDLAPGDLDAVFFVSSGSEANESAIKFTRQYQQAAGRPTKTGVISRIDSYHGTSMGALSATGLKPVREPFLPLLPGFTHVPNTLGYSDGVEAARVVEEEILRRGADQVGMVIAEPVQNGGGALVPPAGYWRELRRICDRYGVLLVADEVICGFGRLGAWFGSEVVDAEPDMITFAKGATSGYAPIGGVLVRRPLVDKVLDSPAGSFLHGATWGGHPVVMAAAVANITAMREERVIENVARNAPLFEARLHDLAEAHDQVLDVRGTGYLYALALGHSREEGREYSDADTKRAVYEILPRLALEAGLHLRVDDRGGAKIMLSPPLVATTSELDEITERVSNVLVQLAACL
ncbi:MAG: aminotransferase class III-fold pyridoxal phosphate-dependent enzyme [Acidimicrobiia bacterium]|nr:aminotransferase class III-fold pyridoxal phosphate-dependent enzyme [Acidimicrobiia bacterium]